MHSERGALEGSLNCASEGGSPRVFFMRPKFSAQTYAAFVNSLLEHAKDVSGSSRQRRCSAGWWSSKRDDRGRRRHGTCARRDMEDFLDCFQRHANGSWTCVSP